MKHSKPVKLSVRGIGNVPSFKNSKMIARGWLITDPKKQAWMDKAAACIESQLISLYQTAEAETPTGQSLQSWILCSLPLDDDLAWVGVTCGSWRRVKPSEEGFEMTIEPTSS